MSSVIVYGDVSPNVIDGSSIWLMSITEALSRVFDSVHLQLKAPLQNDLLIQSVSKLDNVIIHEPTDISEGNQFGPDEARSAVIALDDVVSANTIVVRGMDVCNAFCQSAQLSSKLWSYVTELPFPPAKISKNNLNRINRIAQRSQRMFAQTEAARSYLETIAPAAAGKVAILNPMIPDSLFEYSTVDFSNTFKRPLRIVYSGKLASDWRTLEMLELPRALRDLGVDAELRIVGAKFNRDHTDPSWVGRMKNALTAYGQNPATGVKWLGAKSRAESLREISSADIGLGWRSSALDSSLEISTKALEYMAAGVLPVINRTEDHLSLLGNDYPLFVRGNDTVQELASHIATSLPRLHGWNKKVRTVAAHYSMDRSSQRLAELFTRAGATRTGGEINNRVTHPTKVVIATHDMKFMGELMDHLQRHPQFEVRRDAWPSLHTHDEAASLELLDWADTVFCEWAGPSLAWYSKHKNPNTRLVSRLHRFELGGRWLNDVNWENVDQMIFVSDLVRRMALERLPINHAMTAVIPNTVDCLDFDREKMENARFTLGLVGLVPALKRPDRALDLLERLLEHDDRYTLRFKGRMPWEYPYEWNKPVQKQIYLEFFDRIASSNELNRHVVFDDFSPDIANWQRGIGFILSPSELESFHMAPAEGMAGRSVPIFWPRPGVDEIFGERFVPGDMDTAVSWILEARDPAIFHSWGEEARQTVLRWDSSVIMPKWEETLAPAIRI